MQTAAKFSLNAGDQWGPFVIRELLGEGGMGQVYLAHDPALDRLIAIKVLTGPATRDADGVARFLSEGRALARLSHPSIVAVYTVGQDNGCPWIAMEYVPGHSLGWSLRHDRLAFADFIPVFRQICLGVEEAHRHAIVHRDLKPENVLIGRDGRAKLIDFGIAKSYNANDSARTSTGMVMGTLSYLAPEIARGDRPTQQTDVYGLGAILFEMLVGGPPFEHADNTLQMLEKIKTEPPVIPPEISALIPVELERLVLKSLEKDPTKRHQDVAHLLRDLDRISLADLPSELRLARPHSFEIANEKELRKGLRSEGLSTREIGWVISIASRIEQARLAPPESSDTTVALQVGPVTLEVSPTALEEAKARYRKIRTEVTARRKVAKRDVNGGESNSPSVGDVSTDRASASASDQTTLIKSPSSHKQVRWNWWVVGASLVAMAAVAMNIGKFTGPPPSPQVAPVDVIPKTAPPIADGREPQSEPPAEGERKGLRPIKPPIAAPPATNTSGEGTDTGLDPAVIADLNEKGRQMRNVSVPLPDLAPGDHWIYTNARQPGEADISWRVISVNGDQVTYANPSGETSIGPRSFLAGFEKFTKDPLLGTGSQKWSATPDSLFPLTMLKKVKMTLDGQSDISSTGWHYNVECTSFASGIKQEKFVTPAGAFEIQMITCKSEDPNEGYQDLYYYAPEVGRFIFWNAKRPGSPDRTLILKSYSRGKR